MSTTTRAGAKASRPSSQRLKPEGIDPILVGVTALLCLFGLMMVYSSSAMLSMNLYGSATRIVLNQLLALTLGVGAAILCNGFDYRRLRDPRLVYGLLAVTAGMLMLTSFLPTVKGTSRWLRFAGLSFQPSELAKLAIVIFLAYLLEKKRDRINDFVYTLVPIGVILGTFLVFVLVQPDLGTAIAIGAIAGVVLFTAGLSWSYVGGGLLLIIPIVVKLVLMAPYRRDRILAFLRPWSDPQGFGFQPIQSLIALGSGGTTGLGPGESVQKLFYLPEPHTDFIYAVLGEEYGLVGTLGLLLLFLIWTWRGVRAALRADNQFGFYLATGVTAMVVFQALMNMSIVLSLLPTTGLTLPFISAGGSSLLVCLTATGLLLNIGSRH